MSKEHTTYLIKNILMTVQRHSHSGRWGDGEKIDYKNIKNIPTDQDFALRVHDHDWTFNWWPNIDYVNIVNTPKTIGKVKVFQDLRFNAGTSLWIHAFTVWFEPKVIQITATRVWGFDWISEGIYALNDDATTSQQLKKFDNGNIWELITGNIIVLWSTSFTIWTINITTPTSFWLNITSNAYAMDLNIVCYW